ncbi:hypothetical protein Tco_0537077 [Tanacetum coccineum]
MIGCKVMRTLASVEIEIMLILGLPCCLSSSSVRCLESDPYEAIRQAYLDGTDTESEPFENPIDTETPGSPLTTVHHHTFGSHLYTRRTPRRMSWRVPPLRLVISLIHRQYGQVGGSHMSESAGSVKVDRTARMAVRVPPAMSLGISAGMAEVAAMSESAFRKRFRSSYESSPSLSPPDLPSRKCYRGTSELVEDCEEDDDEEDEEIEESMDSDSVSEDAEDEGPTVEDEDPTAGDEGLVAGVKGPGMDDESYGLDDEDHGLDDEGHGVESDGLGLEEEEEAVPGGQQKAAPVVGTVVSAPLGLGVSASRQPTLTTWTDPEDGMVYINVPAYRPPAPLVQTPPSPEWTSVRLEELSPALFERYDRDIGELFTRSGRLGMRFSPRGQTDAQIAALWHVISDTQGENRDLRLQLAEERRVRLELAEVVDSMRRGQEPREGA